MWAWLWGSEPEVVSWWRSDVRMQQQRHKERREVLTLSLEFTNNYSQEGVLRRNMTPPDRHGAAPEPKHRDGWKICGCARENEPNTKTHQVLAGARRIHAKGGSPVPLSPVSHAYQRGKPRCVPVGPEPCLPLYSNLSPPERIAAASPFRRGAAAVRAEESSRRRFSISPRKSRARGRRGVRVHVRGWVVSEKEEETGHAG